MHVLRKIFFSEYLVPILTLGYVLVIWPFVPEIMSVASLKQIGMAMLPLLLLAIGQTFVLIIAGIDLSITSVVALSSVVAASVMSSTSGILAGSGFAVPFALCAFVLVGLVVGLINGSLVAYLDMPPFLVTLVTNMFIAGSAIWYTTFFTTSVSIGNLPEVFTQIGRGTVFGINIGLLMTVVAALAAHMILARTVFGRWLFAIGHNPVAANVSGVPTKRVTVAAFIICAVFAALASIIYTGRIQTGSPVLGARVLLDVVGAAIIGGVSLFGGKGKIIWVVFGVLFLTTVDTGLQLMGVSQFVTLAVKGGVILLAAAIDATRHRVITGDD